MLFRSLFIDLIKTLFNIVLTWSIANAGTVPRPAFQAASQRTPIVRNKGADKLRYGPGFDSLRYQINAFPASRSPTLIRTPRKPDTIFIVYTPNVQYSYCDPLSHTTAVSTLRISQAVVLTWFQGRIFRI